MTKRLISLFTFTTYSLVQSALHNQNASLQERQAQLFVDLQAQSALILAQRGTHINIIPYNASPILQAQIHYNNLQVAMHPNNLVNTKKKIHTKKK